MPNLLVIGISLSFLLILILLFIAISYKKTKPGIAIVRVGGGQIKVSFTSILSIPLIHKTYEVNIVLHEVNIEFKGSNALKDKDGKTIHLKSKIYFKIPPNQESVKQVIDAIGSKKTFDKEYITNLFEHKLREVFKFITRHYRYDEILQNEDYYKKHLLEELGVDFYGYSLEDLVIENIEKG